MTTKVSIPRPIETMAGVRPLTEGTALTTEHYIDSQGIRFFNGKPQKIGGFESLDFDGSNSITGVARSLFSTILNGVVQTMIGTNTRLYSLSGSTLTNVNPLKTSSTAAANSLTTLYGTLANNPITTINGNKVLTIADTAAVRMRAGDTVTLSGAATTNGVPDTDINSAQIVRSVATNGLSFTIIVNTAATSSGSGGGASVLRKSGLINLAKASHGLTNGERVKIAGAATFGGVTDVQINLEFIIRNVAAGSFDFMTAGTATSSASAGGGAATVYYPQIDSGLLNETAGQGYGMGKYGVGAYGTSLLSSTAIALVRTWFFTERFSSVIMMTAGNQTGIYEWGGAVSAAPVLVTNAPTAINYAFVSNNILVTFGAQGVENRIKTSDIDDRTNWTSSSTNQVFVDDVEGAGRLLSHLSVKGVNLIFTSNQTRTFRYIGGQAVWEIKVLDSGIGILSPMARCEAGGIGFWVGADNFYMWRGGVVEVVPANSQAQTTLLKYIFENINRAQLSKNFMWHNKKFNEVQFHYADADNNEPNRIARLNLHDFSWCPDIIDRTAAEYPNISLQYPRLVDSAGILYRHEKGVDADGAALPWSLTTNDKVAGKNNATIVSAVPDSTQTGNINVNITGRRFPQSVNSTMNEDYIVSPTTERVPTKNSARLWRYTFSGEAIGQEWAMGQWFEELQEGAGN